MTRPTSSRNSPGRPKSKPSRSPLAGAAVGVAVAAFGPIASVAALRVVAGGPLGLDLPATLFFVALVLGWGHAGALLGGTWPGMLGTAAGASCVLFVIPQIDPVGIGWIVLAALSLGYVAGRAARWRRRTAVGDPAIDLVVVLVGVALAAWLATAVAPWATGTGGRGIPEPFDPTVETVSGSS